MINGLNISLTRLVTTAVCAATPATDSGATPGSGACRLRNVHLLYSRSCLSSARAQPSHASRQSLSGGTRHVSPSRSIVDRTQSSSAHDSVRSVEVRVPSSLSMSRRPSVSTLSAIHTIILDSGVSQRGVSWYFAGLTGWQFKRWRGHLLWAKSRLRLVKGFSRWPTHDACRRACLPPINNIPMLSRGTGASLPLF